MKTFSKIVESGLTFYPPAVAEKIQSEFEAGDPDWTYTVEVYDSGWARVRIEDEDGEFVGYADK